MSFANLNQRFLGSEPGLESFSGFDGTGGLRVRKILLMLSLCVFVSSCSKPPTSAVARIEAEGGTCWTGSFDGMQSGCGNAEFEMIDPEGRFDAFVRKLDDDGLTLKLSLIIDGEVVDSASGNVPGGPYSITVRNWRPDRS